MTFIFHEMRSQFPTNSRPDYLLILYDKYRELLPHIRYNETEPYQKFFTKSSYCIVRTRESSFFFGDLSILLYDPLYLLLTDVLYVLSGLHDIRR